MVWIPEQRGRCLCRLIVGVFYLPFASIFLLRYCTLGSYLTSNVFIPSSLNWTMFRLPEHSGGRVRRSIFDIFCLPFASIFSLRDCTLSSYFLSNIFLLSVYHLTVFYSPEHTVGDVRHLIVGPWAWAYPLGPLQYYTCLLLLWPATFLPAKFSCIFVACCLISMRFWQNSSASDTIVFRHTMRLDWYSVQNMQAKGPPIIIYFLFQGFGASLGCWWPSTYCWTICIGPQMIISSLLGKSGWLD